MRYKAQQTDAFVILSHFLPFDPPNNPKNQNFENMKKASGDVIIYTCVPKFMIQSYDICFLRYAVQQTYFVILGHFLPFTPLLTLKIKTWKKCNTNLDTLSFYRCVPKMKII